MIIAFEGSHRAGKGTQIKRLAEKIKSAGKKVFVFCEPGGTEAENEKFLRRLFAAGEPAPGKQLAAFQKERKKFYRKLKKVKLENPEAVVLIDRSVLSLEIQRVKGADRREVRKMQEKFLPNYDLIIVLDMGKRGEAEGWRVFKKRSGRKSGKGNPYRQSGEGYHRRLISFYHRAAEGGLFPRFQPKIAGVDACLAKEMVFADVWTEVEKRLKGSVPFSGKLPPGRGRGK